MKFLHTADWHIGQLFHEYDRTYEHQQFLNWLIEILCEQKIDVLLISGDIFDISNPAAASVKMFYTFLNQATKKCSALQIIIIAGNHDSASRLEAPKPLLESSNIHIVGVIERKKDAENCWQFDYEKLVIPIYDDKKQVKIWCLAIPFLRMGDYPTIADTENPYTAGVAALYQEVYEYARKKQEKGQIIIAMGHLHTANAEITDKNDKTERPIMGGVECVDATAFNENIKYVALGHIHKAQKVAGKEHIRYSGSPIPLSFSELNYKHQVVVFEIENEEMTNLTFIEVPRTVPLWQIPAKHKVLKEVLLELEELAKTLNLTTILPENAPYLEIKILLEQPEAALRHKIEKVLENELANKQIRLTKIDTKYSRSDNSTEQEFISPDKLQELSPLDVFLKEYKKKYPIGEILPELVTLFNQVVEEVNQTEK